MSTITKIATKTLVKSGKVVKAHAGLNSMDVHEVHVGAITMCLNHVAEFAPSGTIEDPIDKFVWDGDAFYSRQSGRTLYVVKEVKG